MKEESTGILAIAKRVASILKLDEEGKIDKFYRKEIKKAKSAIGDLKYNKEILEREKTKVLDNLQEALEDKTIAVDEAYENVEIDKIKTNADCTSFAEVFWRRVSNAENNLKFVEEEIEKKTKHYKAEIEAVEKQIEAYQKRINKLSK